jgi:two-component system chemotaxis sensor kinase CheA
MPERFDRSRFLQTFVAEARERLARMEQGLVALEREPSNPDLFNEVMREAHTLKGSARMVGLMKVDTLAHCIEEVVSALRDSAEPPSRPATDVLLEASDALKALVEEAAGGPPVADISDLVTRMARWGGPSVQPAPRPPEAAGAPAPIPGGDARPESRAQRIAASAGTVRVEVSKLETLSNLSLDLLAEAEHMKRADRRLDRSLRDVQRLRRVLTELAVRLEGADKAPLSLVPIARDLAAAAAQHRSLADELSDVRQSFQADAHRAGLVIDELRELAIELHMLPIATVFDAFPRAVRDLAAECEKEIQFVIEGGEVKLDKKIIEEIGEPLLHLLRNAVVHGIESPEQRERSGKPRRGTIHITAATRANHILITVRDDGAGIDVETLKARAVERGVIAEAAAQTLTHQQALELAFVPGLSTTRMITDVSGRGVGMDVVRATARRLNGAVTVASQPGAGCTVTLELPLTAAIKHVILVRAGGYDMAVPSSFVRTIVNCPYANDELPRTFTWQGDTLPLFSLAGLMELESDDGGNGDRRAIHPPDGLESPAPRVRRIVTVHAAGEGLALVAEGVLDEREVILRSLGPHFAQQRKVMAATLTAEGRVVPVLDIPGLIEAAKTYRPQPAAKRQPKPRPALLLVEDSVITADLERFILEQAEYEVVVAADGLEALARLGERRFDLIVADLEMPRMDGFALLERVRASSEYAKLPVVIVTSRQTLEDKRRGLALGANAYITKGTFDQNALLDTIGRLIG